jgi:hypothetical protein
MKKIKGKIAVATAAAFGASSSLTMFEQFALAAAFNTADWELFKTQEKANQQGQSQRVNTNSHTNNNPHSNYNSHTNTGSNTDTSTPHHQLVEEHTYTQHSNQPAGEHVDACKVTVNGSCVEGHWNQTASGYSQQAHSQHTQYSDAPIHNQHSNHTNNNPHTNESYHNNYGFDHTNYIPSTPEFFDIGGLPIGRVTKIGLYSYDRNIDGYGSQDANSRDVYYDLSIRPVGGSWTALVNNQKANSGEGYLYDLDTTLFVDGDYDLRAIARNPSREGVTYQSYEKIIRVRIQQNYSPEITVQNGAEFINFTFGIQGALSPSEIYKRYQERLYADGDNTQQEGIFVKIQMRDLDKASETIQNWQKGRIYLLNPSGAMIAGSSVSIVWADTQSYVTTSEGQYKTGIAFIPKSVFTNVDMKNAKVAVEVQDYKDAACTQPAGPAVTQTIVSSGNPTQMTFNVDVTKPTVSASDTNYAWRNTNPSVGLNFADATSGILTREYQITSDNVVPTTWKSYTGNIAITNEGQWYIWYRAVDKLRNEQIGSFGSYKLDKTIPNFFSEQFDVPGKDDIRIEVTATDNLSGVKRIQLPNGTWVNGASANYTVVVEDATPFTFRVEDNAGNIGSYTVIVNPAPRINGLAMIDHKNPPKGTAPSVSKPIVYPVSSPTRIKGGYKMTFRVDTKFADMVELRLYDRQTGQRVDVYTESGVSDSVIVNTSTRMEASTNVTFWLSDRIPKGTELDMKVIGHRIRTDGALKTTVDSVLGDHFGIVVGSSREDASVNQTN